MSRSSPGRYSLHDFAKNVYDVHAFGADGREVQTMRPDPYGWNVSWTRRQRDREVQGVRRSRRRHLSRRRHDARAHQHAGGDDVGAWPRRSRGDRRVRGTGGHALACRDAIAARRDAARVHRAEPAVPDGQPVRIRTGNDSHIHRRVAHVPLLAPSHRDRCGTRQLREGRREDRPPGRRDLRRVSGVRARELHLSRRLLALRERRRHGASQQHGDHLVRVDRDEPRQPARHRRPRVLSLLERRAHPSEGARAVRFRSRQSLRRAVAGRRLHAVLRAAGDAARPTRRSRRRPPGRSPA